MKSISLYNQDGSLCSEAQLLVYPKPADISMVEWRKRLKNFRVQLSTEDLKEFNKLKMYDRNTRWSIKNSEKAKKSSKEWYKKNKEGYLERKKARNKAKRLETKSVTPKVKLCNKKPLMTEEGRAKRIARQKKWRQKNPKKIKDGRAKFTASNPTYRSKYRKERILRDPLYHFYENIRRSSNRVVKQLALGNKPTNTLTWLGCSQEELKARFESLFTEGMTWENYGEWHVDHIRPVSSFAPEEWALINHYTNLQPLWAKDNLMKGDSWEQ